MELKNYFAARILETKNFFFLVIFYVSKTQSLEHV